jgi:hypothetical protein
VVCEWLWDDAGGDGLGLAEAVAPETDWDAENELPVTDVSTVDTEVLWPSSETVVPAVLTDEQPKECDIVSEAAVALPDSVTSTDWLMEGPPSGKVMVELSTSVALLDCVTEDKA